jgi:hypothetical protein
MGWCRRLARLTLGPIGTGGELQGSPYTFIPPMDLRMPYDHPILQRAQEIENEMRASGVKWAIRYKGETFANPALNRIRAIHLAVKEVCPTVKSENFSEVVEKLGLKESVALSFI